jgi:16S rRNA (cytosine967-C5)-methyltransferase
VSDRRGGPRRPPGRQAPAGAATRRLAADALGRIEREGAYANLVLSSLLDDADLDRRDRAFVTELVAGTTRMRRACDALVDPFLSRPPDPVARTWLRLGAYQLAFAGVPPHAAVAATVAAAPRRVQGFLNAVLRRVSQQRPTWPDEATRLSVPDWIVDVLGEALGRDDAVAAVEAMNRPPSVDRRPDGYVQGRASQWVAELVGARPGERVLDAAAAPGGKATAMAEGGAFVVAADVRAARVGLVAANVAALDLARSVVPVVADGRRPPFPAGSFDRVLLDAPCTGLGTLGRRADLRWRGGPDDVQRLAGLQRDLVDALVPLVRPGGTFVYGVCTLTAPETVGIDEHLSRTWPDLVPAVAPPGPWRPRGRGALLVPQAAGTDGMYVLRLRVPAGQDEARHPADGPDRVGEGMVDR